MGNCVRKKSYVKLVTGKKTPFVHYVARVFMLAIAIHGESFTSEAASDMDDEIDMGGGNVYVITSKGNWEQKISEAEKQGKIVVANFSASWCGPCRVIAPLYAELSEKYPSLMFLTIDVDKLMVISSFI
ncbi:hypothetical protein ZIOFF_000623 [Zingiber officinale]|uniref:Thioredoxin domain-containing protein n=1 Tax=Zingiber officinale TaxID=94328 RepID=A0A8J5HTU9_ZINOF|nr:hypothetical protein ZIOFF_000623 [Zingiber officinale]